MYSFADAVSSAIQTNEMIDQIDADMKTIANTTTGADATATANTLMNLSNLLNEFNANSVISNSQFYTSAENALSSFESNSTIGLSNGQSSFYIGTWSKGSYGQKVFTPTAAVTFSEFFANGGSLQQLENNPNVALRIPSHYNSYTYANFTSGDSIGVITNSNATQAAANFLNQF